MVDRLTPSAPPRVWLQVEYVRSDLVRAVMPENWRDDPDWVRLAPLLGVASNAGLSCRPQENDQ